MLKYFKNEQFKYEGIKQMYLNIETARMIVSAYNAACKPLCRELGLPQTAFDILMFLGNNSKYKTAGEIVEIRRIKANLVSVNVDRLVREGYLERHAVSGDRRKTELICTKKAQAVISRGREIQDTFPQRLCVGMDEKTYAAFLSALDVVKANLAAMQEDDVE